MTKTAAQLDAEIAEALSRPAAPAMPSVEVRKISSADPKTWAMRHSPGPRGSAVYGVFINSRQIGTISGESRGHRQPTYWNFWTIGEWTGPGPRPVNLPMSAGAQHSFAAAKKWVIENIANDARLKELGLL